MPQRNRVLPQRKVDENATSRHSRQASSIPVVGANRLGVKDLTARPTIGRQILSEVTTTANRRVCPGRYVSSKPLTSLQENIPRTTALGKEKEEVVGTKRSRSNSASIELPQRIPFGKSQAVPPVTNVVPARAPLSRAPRPQIPVFTRKFQRVRDHVIAEDEREVVEDDYRMDVEEDDVMLRATTADQLEVDEVEEQVMVPSSDLPDEDEGVDMDSPAMEVEEETQVPIAPAVWPALDPHKAAACRKQLQNIRETFLDVAEEADPSMVSEYADDIFEYMNELEVHEFYLAFTGGTDLMSVLGGSHARSRLHETAGKRLELADALSVGRLDVGYTRSVPSSSRDALDRSQHPRPLPLETQSKQSQGSTRGYCLHVHCLQVRRSHGRACRRVRRHCEGSVYQGGHF